jgi:hypothetical protein
MPEERIVAPDPVTEPEAYQQALVDMLGERDPVDVLTRTPDLFEELTAGLDLKVLQKRPEPNEWSVEELLAHFFNGEIVHGFRWRFALAQSGGSYPGYDQDAWTELAHPSFPEMLGAFASLRRANVWLFEETPTSEWDRYAIHEERGKETFGMTIQLLAGHDLAHLKQLEQTIAAVTK